MISHEGKHYLGVFATEEAAARAWDAAAIRHRGPDTAVNFPTREGQARATKPKRAGAPREVIHRRSEYVGVCWRIGSTIHTPRPWKAAMRYGGAQHDLGAFATEARRTSLLRNT